MSRSSAGCRAAAEAHVQLLTSPAELPTAQMDELSFLHATPVGHACKERAGAEQAAATAARGRPGHSTVGEHGHPCIQLHTADAGHACMHAASMRS